MQKTALFVDLSNFYTRFVQSGIDEPKDLRNYFLAWFDFSVLAEYLTTQNPDIWVFYSTTRLGPSEARIDNEYLTKLIERFDGQKGVCAQDVNIRGEQRESYSVKCEKCGRQADTQAKSEKGIDTSLTVHLFDTLDSWDTAFLLSGDADFVPAVRSLRRRGKIVNGAGMVTNPSKALIRECFEYRDLQVFFKLDYSAYHLFGPSGLITSRLKDLLIQSKKEESAQVAFTLTHHPGSQLLRVKLESNIIDFDSLRSKIEGLKVNQVLGQDAHIFELNTVMLNQIRWNLIKYFEQFGQYYSRKETRGEERFELYTAGFRWSESETSYQPIIKE